MLPAAVQHTQDNPLVKFPPIPERHREREQFLLITDFVCPPDKGTQRAARIDGVPVGDDGRSFLQQLMQGVSREAGPAELHLCPWICHPCAERKRVDIGRIPDYRIIGDIADGVILRHRAGDRPGNEFAFVHPAVIHSHAGIRLRERTVEHPDIRMV